MSKTLNRFHNTSRQAIEIAKDGQGFRAVAENTVQSFYSYAKTQTEHSTIAPYPFRTIFVATASTLPTATHLKYLG